MTDRLKESLLNDLVSRKDVIQYIHKEMDEWINVDEPGDELAYEVEMIINEVPMVDIKNVLNPDSFNGKKPMTKEEWLHTLNTEQLAEWLVEHMDCVSCYCKTLCRQGHDCKLALMEWLKQPHQEKESIHE